MLDQPHPHGPGPLLGHEGVVADELHAEGVRALGHQRAGPAQSDHAEHLAVQLDALPLGALPAAGDQRGVGLGDVARLGQQQRHGLLGHREDVRRRGVDHHDAALGGRGRRRRCRGRRRPGPTTASDVPAASTSAVTWVAERMISACAPTIASSSSSGLSPSWTSTSWPASASRSSPLCAIFSVTSTRATAVVSSLPPPDPRRCGQSCASAKSAANRVTPSTRSSSPRA